MRGIEKKKERRQWKSRNDGQIQDPLFEVDYLCPHIRFLGFHKICDYVINFTDFTLYFINPSYFTYCYFFLLFFSFTDMSLTSTTDRSNKLKKDFRMVD